MCHGRRSEAGRRKAAWVNLERRPEKEGLVFKDKQWHYSNRNPVRGEIEPSPSSRDGRDESRRVTPRPENGPGTPYSEPIPEKSQAAWRARSVPVTGGKGEDEVQKMVSVAGRATTDERVVSRGGVRPWGEKHDQPYWQRKAWLEGEVETLRYILKLGTSAWSF